jgi:enediyne biosynthesis protein E3
MAGILQKLLSISTTEASFAQRKFHFLRDSTRLHLERVGETFLRGYGLALTEEGIESLAQQLNEIDWELRGFAFEGAAMGLDILDQLQPWKAQRIPTFLRGPGRAHAYMVHVGIGWSMARWRLGIRRRLDRLDPLLQWLALDGFGFHEGYFHWPRFADGSAPRFSTLPAYASRAFDQGLGRSLWFVSGADPAFIASAIAHFPEARRDDLWSGIGLACAYAGGADKGDMYGLRLASGSHWPHLAQGAVFAAGARQRAGNMAFQTETACKLLCDFSAQQAAELCDETLNRLTEDLDPAYEVWRRLIREHLQRTKYFANDDALFAGVEEVRR